MQYSRSTSNIDTELLLEVVQFIQQEMCGKVEKLKLSAFEKDWKSLEKYSLPEP